MLNRKEKGFTSLELVGAILIFLGVFTFALDILEIGFKTYTMQSVARSTIRTLSIQGGVNSTTPISASEIAQRIAQSIKKSGVDPNDIRVTFYNGGTPVSLAALPGQSVTADYGEDVYVKVEIDHHWNVFRWIGLGDKTSTFGTEKIGVSEKKYDMDSW